MKFLDLFKKKAAQPVEQDSPPYDDLIAQRESDFEKARKCDMSNYKIVRGIDLKPGDVIVCDCEKVKIIECGCGWGAGNEFGNYFWCKGEYISFPRNFNKWLFQEAPIVLCIKESSK
jgi:hypothetical protein